MGFFGKLSGKEIAEKINDYNETYGEILIGMDKEIISLNKKISSLVDENQKFKRQSSRSSLLSIIAIIIAISTLLISIF